MHKYRELRYIETQTLHAVAGLILNLAFHTEDLDGVGETVKHFLLPNL